MKNDDENSFTYTKWFVFPRRINKVCKTAQKKFKIFPIFSQMMVLYVVGYLEPFDETKK